MDLPSDLEQQVTHCRYRAIQHAFDPDAQYSLGVALARAGYLGAAIMAFERAAELRPRDPEAHYALGENLVYAGRLEEARFALQRASSLDPDHHKTRFALQLLEEMDPNVGLRLGRSSHHYDFAHVVLREFVFSNLADRIEPRTLGGTQQALTEIWDVVGQKRITQGLTAESATGLEAQITTCNGCPCLVVTMPTPAAILQCFFVAIVSFTSDAFSKPFDESAIGYFTLELGYNEDSDTPCTYLGRWYADGSRHNYGLGPEAEQKAFLAAVNEVLVQDTEGPKLEAAIAKMALETNRTHAEAAIVAGTFLADNGRGVEAGLAFRRVWESDAVASYNLGTVLIQQGRYAEAGVAFRKAIQLKADYVEAYYDLGSTLLNMGKYTAAIEAYLAVVALRPELAGAYRNLGGAYRKIGELEKSIQAHRKGIELGLDDFRTFYDLGIALRANQQLEEAIEAFREALAREPADEGAYLNLGIALDEGGRTDDAVAAYERLIEINPGNSDAYYNLGLIFARRKERARAIEAFERALNADPQNADAKAMLHAVMHAD